MYIIYLGCFLFILQLQQNNPLASPSSSRPIVLSDYTPVRVTYSGTYFNVSILLLLFLCVCTSSKRKNTTQTQQNRFPAIRLSSCLGSLLFLFLLSLFLFLFFVFFRATATIHRALGRQLPYVVLRRRHNWFTSLRRVFRSKVCRSECVPECLLLLVFLLLVCERGGHR